MVIPFRDLDLGFYLYDDLLVASVQDCPGLRVRLKTIKYLLWGRFCRFFSVQVLMSVSYSSEQQCAVFVPGLETN